MNASSWIDAASEAEMADDDVIGLQEAEHNIALYKVDGSVFTTDNICTHGHARLCDGFLDGHEIECPPAPGEVRCPQWHPYLRTGYRAIEVLPRAH